MRGLKRAKRVRLHLTAAAASAGAESIEGLLVARRRGEYVVALPLLLAAAGAEPHALDDAKTLMIPRANVAHYEVLR